MGSMQVGTIPGQAVFNNFLPILFIGRDRYSFHGIHKIPLRFSTFFIRKMLYFFHGFKQAKVISMDFARSLLKLSLNMPRNSITTSLLAFATKVDRNSFFFFSFFSVLNYVVNIIVTENLYCC